MDAPYLLERDHTSLTVAWRPVHDAAAYELQMSQNSPDAWVTLSNSIKSSSIKKKNLVHGSAYIFRVRYQSQRTKDWSSFSQPTSNLSVLDQSTKMMDPPELQCRDGSSITIRWKEVPGASGYNLKFREDGESWTHIDSIVHGSMVKKKGLVLGKNYQFSISPAGPAEDSYSYSNASSFLSVVGLSPFVSKLFPDKLFVKDKSGHRIATPTSDVIAGKIIAVYFSAHWCGPCRQFTPRLADIYQQAKQSALSFEVVFCSADHDEHGFVDYYNSMPWAAIPFDADEREEFMGKFQVSGIPRLVVLKPSGEILDNNAAQSISVDAIRAWTRQCEV